MILNNVLVFRGGAMDKTFGSAQDEGCGMSELEIRELEINE